MSKAIVLHSGGLDSTVALYWAVREFGKGKVESIGVHYGQRHEIELAYAQKVCDMLEVPRRVIHLNDIQASILTDRDAEIPKVSYEEIEGLSPAYVPFRNGLMLSNIASIAQAEKFSNIVYGAHAEDALNWAYPDCTPEFNGAMANAIFIGTNQEVRLLTPLQWLEKHQIISLGLDLGINFADTWSCYHGGKVHCGECPTCRARQKGFSRLGVVDPTVYLNGGKDE